MPNVSAIRLSASGVTKAYGGVRVLDTVDFDVAAGEVHALVGENGAGKSTLIRILGGAVRPDAGVVRLDGVPLPAGDPRRVRQRVAAHVALLQLERGIAAARRPPHAIERKLRRPIAEQQAVGLLIGVGELGVAEAG